MSEEEKETYLIFSISKEYNSVIDALKTIQDDDYDMELIKNRLFEKEVDLRRENNALSAKVLLFEETKRSERKISQKDQKTRGHPREKRRRRSYFGKVKGGFGNQNSRGSYKFGRSRGRNNYRERSNYQRGGRITTRILCDWCGRENHHEKDFTFKHKYY